MPDVNYAALQDAAVEHSALRSVAQPLIIGVTSHRNLVASEVGAIRQGVREFLQRLRDEFPTLPLWIVSALAAGGDQLVAGEALSIGATLIAPLPLPRSVYMRDFTDASTRECFESLCARAIVFEPVVVDESSHEHLDERSHSRNWHYAQAGMYIASHCHILLALWDGKSSTLPGGTAQIVQYHLTGQRPLLIERRHASGARNPLDEDNARLVYHVVCSRAQAHGAPAPALQAMQTFWRVGAEVSAGSEFIPRAFRAALERIVALNADVARYAQQIEASSRDVARRPLPAADQLHASPIERSFAAADWLAVHFQRRVFAAMRAMYTIAALMGIAFVFYDELAQDYMIFAFLGLFVAALTLDFSARHRDWHRKYLDYRALAEGLRVQAYWRRAGLSMTGDAEFAHDNFLQKQDVELTWIRNVMRSAALASAAQGLVAPDLAGVIAEWIGESGLSGQLFYYERRLLERTRRHRLTRNIGAVSLWAGVAISIFLAATIFRLSHDVQNALVAVMAAFSIIAAVREAYAYRKADKELIKQYRFMRSLFARARGAIDRTSDPSAQREILRALGEAALAEHAEWTLMHRERPLERARM